MIVTCAKCGKEIDTLVDEYSFIDEDTNEFIYECEECMIKEDIYGE